MTSFENKKGKDLYYEKGRKPSAKVKNPCKICSETVNIKTGLQCKGACKKWAHFDCLKYSPALAECIQRGSLKINCPCPDCENDSKVSQSQACYKDKGYQSQRYGLNKEFGSKYNECDKTFCPGIPQTKSIKGLENLNALKDTLRPIPYGVCEGTSYEYIVGNQTRQETTNKRIEAVNLQDLPNENEQQEDEDEEKSDVENTKYPYQTVLMAKSSSQLTAAICCDASQFSPINREVVTNNPTKKNPLKECCVGGPCSSTSSTSSSSSSSSKKKSTKEKKKKKKDKKDKKKKKEKKKKSKEKKQKKKKNKKEKKEKKKKKGKKEKKKGKGKDKKGNLSPCCSSCCTSDAISQGSNESDDSSDSTTTGTSAKSDKSTRSTQAPCGLTLHNCPRRGVNSPVKLMKSEGCSVKTDGVRPPSPRARRPNTQMRPPPTQYSGGTNAGYPTSNPNCPPLPRSFLQQQQRQYPIPPSHGKQVGNCLPGCYGMKPTSQCPPTCPGPIAGRLQTGAAQFKDMAKGYGLCGSCLPGCCDPYRANTYTLSTNSTHLLCLSPTNRSKSCCTLDKSNKKEGKSLKTWSLCWYT